jgi:hypothetical protein
VIQAVFTVGIRISLKINRAQAIFQSNQLFFGISHSSFSNLPQHFTTEDNNMAIYGTYGQNGLDFSITNVSSSSDDKNPTFTYDWSCTNHNWTLTGNGQKASLSGAHSSETGSVTVTVTETADKDSREFGGPVDTRGFPA